MTLHVTDYARGGSTWLTILSHLMIRTQTRILHRINLYKIQKNRDKICASMTICNRMCSFWVDTGHTHGYGWNSCGYSGEAQKRLWSILRGERRGERRKDSCLIVFTTRTRCYLYTLLLLALCLLKSSKSCHACHIPCPHKVQRTLSGSSVKHHWITCPAVTGCSCGWCGSHALRGGNRNSRGCLISQHARLPPSSGLSRAASMLSQDSETGPKCRQWAHTKRCDVVARSGCRGLLYWYYLLFLSLRSQSSACNVSVGWSTG